MDRAIDYRNVDIPTDKDSEEYTYAERRAEILTLIEQSGHPGLLSRSQLANRYGCSHSTISNDINNVLADYVDEILGSRRLLTTHAVIEKSVQELIAEGEYRKAAQTILDFNKWVDDYRDAEEFEDRLAEIEDQLSREGEVAEIGGLTSNGDGGVDLQVNR